MNTLAENYFIRDLSPAEDEELAGLLAASPEEALRFAALAEADWRRLGLAEPSMKSPGLKKMGWLGAAAVIAAVAALSFRGGSPPKARPNLSLAGEAFQAEGASRRQRLGSREAAPAPAAAERLLATALPGAKGRFMLQLLNASAEEEAAAYDAAGRRIKKLEKLGFNRWAWDGKMASGAAAPPGRYELKLERGEGGLSKWVEIEAR